jgi:hypothetical protein
MTTDQIYDFPIDVLAGQMDGSYPPAVAENWLRPGELGKGIDGRAAVTREVGARVLEAYRSGRDRQEREQQAWAAHYAAWCTARDEVGATAYREEQQRLYRKHPPVGMLGVITSSEQLKRRSPILEQEIAGLASDARDAAVAKYEAKHPEPSFEVWARSKDNPDR